MGLNQLKAEGPKRSFAAKCCISRVLDALDADTREFLLYALSDDSGYTHASIARALNDDGFDYVSAIQTGRHRRGDCSCNKREAGK